MNAVAEAVELWTRQLNEASRQHLAVDWTQGGPSLVVASSAFADRLIGGQTVRWGEFGDASTLGPIAEKAAEFRKTRGSDCLTLVVGAVRFGRGEDWLPVGLVPLSVDRVARRVDDWSISSAGPAELCRITAAILSLDFGVSFDLHDVVGAALETLRRSLPEDVELDPRIGLAFHASEWLDILRDVRTFVNLHQSPLVSAMAAGEPGAEPDPGVARPASPVTVLESDTSQAEVVARAVAGQSLVVEGPPGTGKSQTIASIAAELAGEGRRVLVVAQKRAAIDVLLRRLADAGVADLTLDLFDDGNGLSLTSQRPAAAAARVEVPMLPDLRASEAHHAEVARIAARSASVLRCRADGLPELSYDHGRRIAPEAEKVRTAIASVARAADTLRQQGVIVTTARLIETALVAGTPILDADRGLALVDDPSQTVGRALELGGVAVAWLAVSSELSDTATVGQLRGAQAARLVRGFGTGSLRDAVVGRARSLLTAIENALRVTWNDRTPLGKITARVAPIASRPAIGPAVTALLVELKIGDQLATEAAVEDVRPALRSLASAVESVRPHAATLTDLGEPGLLSAALGHPDPVGAFDGMLARSLLRAPAVLPSATLDGVAEQASAAIATARAQQASDLAVRAEAAARGRATAAGVATQLEAVRRKSAGKRVAARDLGDALGSVLRSHAVVLASPASIARSFPKSVDLFDTVIFEEASQVEVAAAVPALARAGQALVFGDSYQLPPTRFFRAAQADVPHPVLGMDSLLDAFATLLAGTDRRAMLRWHYRSRDDRLVSFVANSPTFYGGQLVLSPSAPGLPSPVELRRVDPVRAVDEVVDLVIGLGDVGSLGIVTFGVNTSRSIERGLELAKYAAKPEFVVRSVEQMQGDERDTVVVVLPLVADGSSPLQALGPLNQVGGERRLNVAITRARQRMIVVSSYGSIELAGAASRGAVTLRQYLEHLEGAADSDPADGPSDSEVLTEIARLLEAGGLDASTYPRTSLAAVRLSATAAGGLPVAVDVDVVDQHELAAHDREVVRRGELRRRGWKVCRTTLREWMDDAEGLVARIRSTSLGQA